MNYTNKKTPGCGPTGCPKAGIKSTRPRPIILTITIQILMLMLILMQILLQRNPMSRHQ